MSRCTKSRKRGRVASFTRRREERERAGWNFAAFAFRMSPNLRLASVEIGAETDSINRPRVSAGPGQPRRLHPPILKLPLTWNTALTMAKAMKPTKMNTAISTALAMTFVNMLS